MARATGCCQVRRRARHNSLRAAANPRWTPLSILLVAFLASSVADCLAVEQPTVSRSASLSFVNTVMLSLPRDAAT
jgi:hypothetical protein